MQVSIAYSERPGQACEMSAEVAATATVIEAIRASGVLERYPSLDISSSEVGVWGRPCSLQATLAAGDRVEIYRPLQVDPKVARRLRAKRSTKPRSNAAEAARQIALPKSR